MKLLLTSVFGPYGVDDEYGEKENKMELFHNQVTREQGIFSYRFNHASHGLYFIAENVDVPTTVLDFPTLKRFKNELKKGYEYIGISFIIPNYQKAKKMAEIIREFSPDSKIILGSHGVNIPGIENMIEHDYICRGEGISFFRKLFNEDLDKSIKHPITYSSFNRQVMGVPWPSGSGILITGVGCVNKCRFCATSHFFDNYTAYLKTGQDIFDVCCQFQEKLGVQDFGILDENFLKTPQRAIELLEVMEKKHRFFSFSIFSSAETLIELGDLDILVRLGIKFIWIGVESKKEIYEKNKGANFSDLFKELKRRGISVMASAILFLEDHDKKSIWEDIEFATSLNADYLQFMQLGPIPGTALYKKYEEEGKLLKDVPYLAQHGQKQIWFSHDSFSKEETEIILKNAFDYDYTENGASVFRAMDTTMQGYKYCKNHNDSRINSRGSDFKNMLKMMRYFLLSARIFVENEASKNLLSKVRKNFNEQFGRIDLSSLLVSCLVILFSIKERLKIKLFSDIRQPKELYKKFNFNKNKPSFVYHNLNDNNDLKLF
ncbi:MAG TPA: radical SAM protein, partial [Candidatus Paceibacterota bacterium]